jgi:hypothetical protein
MHGNYMLLGLHECSYEGNNNTNGSEILVGNNH